MNRREFLGTGAAAMASGFVGTSTGAGGVAAMPERRDTRGHSLTIRDYLCREAERITDRALTEFKDADTWRRLIPEKRRQYLDMMGVTGIFPPESRPPLKANVTGI